jgi:probable rRNA maturation factor
LITAEIEIAAPDWDDVSVERVTARALEQLNAVRPEGWAAGLVALLFTDDATIRTMNRTFRGRDSATNVLSFPTAGPPGLPPHIEMPLGDIALAAETCLREAAEKGVSPEDHTLHLIIHGILHLLGYDHVDDQEAAAMEALETRLLAKLGVADPYR